MSRGIESSCLPENIRKHLAPEAKQALGKAAETMPEVSERMAAKAEKELHRQFEQWLRMREIPFGTARMDRKSNFTVGWPDYTLCLRGRAVFVEIKVGANGLGHWQQAIRAELLRAGAVYRVCRSLAECIEAVGSIL